MRWKLLINSAPVRVIRRLLGERDYRGAWPGVRDVLRAIWAKTFAEEGSGGRRWAPLSRETLKWRAEIGAAGRPILDAGGRLRDSVLGGAGAISIIRRESIEIGTDAGYAGSHQFGGEVEQPLRSGKARKAFGSAGSLIKRIPARPFLTQAGTVDEPELDELTGSQVAETFAEALAAKLAGAFRGGR